MIYDVYIDTESTVTGNAIHVIMPARSQDEAMNQALAFIGLDYRGVNSILVAPRKETYVS